MRDAKTKKKTTPDPVEDYAGRGIPEALLSEGKGGLLFLAMPKQNALRLAASLIEQVLANSPNVGRYEFGGVLIRDGRKTRSVDMSVAVRPDPPMVRKAELDAVIAMFEKARAAGTVGRGARRTG